MSRFVVASRSPFTKAQHGWVGWATADAALAALIIGMSVSILFALACYTPPSKITELENETSAALGVAEDWQNRAKDLQSDLQSAISELEQSKNLSRLASRREQQVRQELLGIQGSMHSTIFLVDISGSVGKKMADGTARPNWGGDGSAWGFIRKQVDAWVQYLPVDQYRIIAFHDQLQEFPRDEQWALQGDGYAATKAFLNTLEPLGLTFTEKAIRRAAHFHPSNIVLITDGAPSDRDGKFDAAQVERILDLVESKEFSIPINVIAINNYFDPRFGTFLHRLAAKSNGSFLGL